MHHTTLPFGVGIKLGLKGYKSGRQSSFRPDGEVYSCVRRNKQAVCSTLGRNDDQG